MVGGPIQDNTIIINTEVYIRDRSAWTAVYCVHLIL